MRNTPRMVRKVKKRIMDEQPLMTVQTFIALSRRFYALSAPLLCLSCLPEVARTFSRSDAEFTAMWRGGYGDLGAERLPPTENPTDNPIDKPTFPPTEK